MLPIYIIARLNQQDISTIHPRLAWPVSFLQESGLVR